MKTGSAFILAAFLVLSCAHAQWQKIGQKSGGNVNGLETNKFGTLFCSFGNRVYRSIDGGNAWSVRIVPAEKIQDDQLFTSADSAVGHAILLQTGRDSVYRSTNEGDTWELMTWLEEALGKKRLERLFATRYGDLYASSTDGSTYRLWKSRDNGNTFVSVLSELGNVEQVYQAEDSTLYIVHGDKLTRLKTNGSVEAFANAGVHNLTSTKDFSTAPVVLYAIKNNQPHRSKDFGATWTSLPFETTVSYIRSRPLVGVREGEVIAFTTNHKDSTVIYRLSAGGSKWTKIREMGVAMGNPLVLQNGTMLAAGSDGMYLSEDGSSWSNSSQGIESFALIFAAIVDANTLLAAGFNGKVFNSVSQGQQWGTSSLPVQPKGDVPFGNVFITSKSAVVLPTSEGLLYSNDQGSNFVQCMLDDKPILNQTSSIVERANGDLFCTTPLDSSILRSTDGGLHWSRAKKTKVQIGSALVTDNVGNILITSNTGILKCDPVSYDITAFDYAGKILPWLAYSPNASLFGIERIVEGTSRVYKLHRKAAGGSDEVFDIPQGLDDYLQLAASYRGDAYITTEQGLFVLPAGVNALTKVDFFRNDLVTFIQRQRNGFMLAATAFGGVYLDTSGVVSVQDEPAPDFPNAFRLAPNPASDMVEVQDVVGDIESLGVYDILGNEVMTVQNTSSPQVRFSTASLPSGAYRLHIHTAGGVYSGGVYYRIMVIRK